MKSKILKRVGLVLGALALAAAGIAAASYYSPWFALHRVEAALSSGDQQAMATLIDWSAVKTNLTRKLALDALRQAGLKPGDPHVNEVVLGIEGTVDKVVTPQNVAAALQGSEQAGQQGMVVRGEYLSMGSFLFAIQNQATKSAISVRLRRLGPVSWRVDEVMFIDKSLLGGK